MAAVVSVIHYALRLLSLVILIQAILSFVMSPYHPVRQRLDQFVEPMLAPIRRVVPPVGMLDLSPLVLIILIQIVDAIIINLFR
jgi:YggT family protein